MHNTLEQKALQKHPSILSTHLVLQTSLSLCLNDSRQYNSILSLRQFLRGTDKFIHSSFIQFLFILRILTLKFTKIKKIVDRNKTNQIRAKIKINNKK